jgi:hypothetical protein
MIVELQFVTNKVTSRNLYNTESECYSLVIKSQTDQLNQLRTNYN